MARPILTSLFSKFLFRETLTPQEKADLLADLGAASRIFYLTTPPEDGVTDARDGQLVGVGTSSPYDWYICRRITGVDTTVFTRFAQVPSAITASKVVDNEAARLLLTEEAAIGFAVVDGDTGKTWMLVSGGNPATSGDWTQLGDRDIQIADVGGLPYRLDQIDEALSYAQGAVGPQGPTGPQGLQGPQGPTGASPTISPSAARTAFVDLLGDDSTAVIGNPLQPFLTGQSAWAALNTLAVTNPSLNYILCLGVGQFGVSLTADWLANILLVGTPKSALSINGVGADGANGIDWSEGTPATDGQAGSNGKSISFESDGLVRVIITVAGGSGGGGGNGDNANLAGNGANGGSGGNITLKNVWLLLLHGIGGSAGVGGTGLGPYGTGGTGVSGNGGNGSTLALENVKADNIETSGGYANAGYYTNDVISGNGGNITCENSKIEHFTSNGGDLNATSAGGQQAGNGGNATLNNVKINYLSVAGGSGDYSGGHGGNLTLENVDGGGFYNNGGDASGVEGYAYGGNSGNSTVSNSRLSSLYSAQGYGTTSIGSFGTLKIQGSSYVSLYIDTFIDIAIDGQPVGSGSGAPSSNRIISP